jgi:hypothetical protein
MTAARIYGSSWSLVVAGGLGFAGASFAFGYSWPIALVCAVTGGVIATRIARIGGSKEIAPSEDSNDKVAGAGTVHSHDAFGKNLHDEYPGINFDAPFVQRLSVLLVPLNRYQKLAFLAFAAQVTISFVLIVLAWLSASAGLVDVAINPEIIDEFALKVFPVKLANQEAATMLRLLFLPLIVLYAVSTFGMILATLLSGRILVADFKRHWKLLLVICAVLFFVATFFLPLETYQTASSLKRRVSDGSLLAYLAVFCFIPLLGMIAVHALPNEAQTEASR